MSNGLLLHVSTCISTFNCCISAVNVPTVMVMSYVISLGLKLANFRHLNDKVFNGIICYWFIFVKSGQVCKGCFLEKDGGKRQEKNGSAKEKTPYRWWRYLCIFHSVVFFSKVITLRIHVEMLYILESCLCQSFICIKFWNTSLKTLFCKILSPGRAQISRVLLSAI